MSATSTSADECPSGEDWCDGPDAMELPCWECYTNADLDDRWGEDARYAVLLRGPGIER